MTKEKVKELALQELRDAGINTTMAVVDVDEENNNYYV